MEQPLLHPAVASNNTAIPIKGPLLALGVTTGEKGPNLVRSILAESSHPTALIFHLLFRTAALLIYLFLSWLIWHNNYAPIFVLTAILLAADFWTVKNVTGRLLVGLRWWGETAPDGSMLWSFEAKSADLFRPNPIDARMFWWSLYGYTAAWMVLALICLLKLSFAWLLIVILALVLNLSNLIGYLKCDKQAQGTGQMMDSFGRAAVFNHVGNKIKAFFT